MWSTDKKRSHFATHFDGPAYLYVSTKGEKGKDADHQALILAPKASKEFVVKREKRRIVTRPMPQSSIDSFCGELTNYKWENVFQTRSVHEKTEAFHSYLRLLLDKYFPTKTVTFSNLDKYWMTPELKQLLRQVQRERIRKGKGGKFKKLWSKFRRLKRRQVKTYYRDFIKDLKTTNPSKWYSQMKKLGGLDVACRGKLEVESLTGLSDRECAEAVAQSFAAVSNEYSPLDRSKLPAFLPAGRPD